MELSYIGCCRAATQGALVYGIAKVSVGGTPPIVKDYFIQSRRHPARRGVQDRLVRNISQRDSIYRWNIHKVTVKGTFSKTGVFDGA